MALMSDDYVISFLRPNKEAGDSDEEKKEATPCPRTDDFALQSHQPLFPNIRVL